MQSTYVHGVDLSPAQLQFQKRTRLILPKQSIMLKPNGNAPLEHMDEKVRWKKNTDNKSAHQPYENLSPGRSVVYDHFGSTRRKPCWRKSIKVVRNKKSKFFSHRYLIEFYQTNRMSHVPHLYEVINLLK